MFAKLKGTVDTIEDDSVILDVHGVGYLVHASRTTIGRLGQTGVAASLLIETHVREDRITLYGFFSAQERDWFRRLITVQGVGPKAALAILSVHAPDQLANALAAGDAKAIARADGVGGKLAARIVAEFKGKESLFIGTKAESGTGSGTGVPFGGGDSLAADAVSALVNLGYGRSEAFSAVVACKARLAAGSEEAPTVSLLIKESLKELSQ